MYTITKANNESNKFKYLNKINKGTAAATGGSILVLKIQLPKKSPFKLKKLNQKQLAEKKQEKQLLSIQLRLLNL